MALSMAAPVELVLLCSVFTSTHMALLGFDPLTDDELCFGLWGLAVAAVRGARANVSPSTPLQIPIHFDRCCTPPPPPLETRVETLLHRLASSWYRVDPSTRSVPDSA